MLTIQSEVVLDLNILSHPWGSSGHKLGSEQEPNLGAHSPREVPYLTSHLNKDAVGLPVQPDGLYLPLSLTLVGLGFILRHNGRNEISKTSRDRKTTSYPVLFLLPKFCLAVVSVNSFFLWVPYDPQLFSKSPKAIDRLCGFDLGQRCSFKKSLTQNIGGKKSMFTLVFAYKNFMRVKPTYSCTIYRCKRRLSGIVFISN